MDLRCSTSIYYCFWPSNGPSRPSNRPTQTKILLLEKQRLRVPFSPSPSSPVQEKKKRRKSRTEEFALQDSRVIPRNTSDLGEKKKKKEKRRERNYRKHQLSLLLYNINIVRNVANVTSFRLHNLDKDVCCSIPITFPGYREYIIHTQPQAFIDSA